MRRAGAFLAGLLALCGLALLLDALFPPDLARYRDRSTLVLDRDGGMLRAYLTDDGAWRLHATPADVAPLYLAMLKAYEDRRFDRHPGVDPLALGRALTQAARHGRIVSGGSTLTMQVARLLEPRRQTVAAKLLEMARALQLEARFGKDEILAMYLTLAPFGGNLEGVRAASLAYFGREPRHLTPGEAALLVALPQSPTARRPHVDPAAARRARDRVLARLVASGALPETLAREAAQEAVPDLRRQLPRSAPHLADRLRAGAAPGSVIATTIDPALQRMAEGVAARARATLEPGAEVALMMVETRSRAVVAYVGGSHAEPSGHVDMVRAVRSPGSALKPMIYAFAFDGLPLHPETLVDDAPMSFAGYRPRNFTGAFRGTVTAAEALRLSLNVPAVAMLARLGPVRVLGRLRGAGARLEMPDGAGAMAGLPLALGGVGVRLEDMAMLYAALADGGLARPLRLRPGDAAGEPRRLFGPEAAWYVADILRGTAAPDGRGGEADRTLAYKTGTSYGYRDAWAAGFTATHTIVVWVGRPDETPRPGAMGRDTPAPILFQLADLPPRAPAAPPPPGVLAAGPGQPLPEPLRRFHLRPGGAAGYGGAASGTPLAVAFPPDGAEVEVGAMTGTPLPLPLEALGGRPPFRWLVNGLPLAADGSGPAAWRPDGHGFAEITVIDAAGRTATSNVRLR